MKMKARDITNDPSLGDGWSHWVTSAPFRAYVKKYGYQVEVASVYLYPMTFTKWTFADEPMRVRIARCQPFRH